MRSEYLVPWLVTNVVAIALVALAVKWPRATRRIFAGIFVAAGLFNAYTGIVTPEAYLTYADTAVLTVYRSFILGEFGRHLTGYILAIAIGQILVGVLLTRDGGLLRLGTIGGTLFLLAITPLGIGSAFPSTLLMAIALLLATRDALSILFAQPSGS